MAYTVPMISAVVVAIAAVWFALERAKSGARSPSVEDAKRQLATPPSRFLEIGEAKVHYRNEGCGTILVLLHGAGTNLLMWQRWADILKDQYRIVRCDIPPSPLTSDSQPTTPWRQLELLELIIENLGIEDFVLIGNSTGANLAVNYAAKHQQRVKALVLSTVPLFSPRPDQYKNPLRRMVDYACSLLAPNYRPRWYYRAYLHDIIHEKANITTEFVDMYHMSSAACGVIDDQASYLASRKSKRGRAWVDQERVNAGLIRCPTLIQWGDANTVLLPAVGDEVAYLFKSASVEVIHYADAAHYPAWEIPCQTASDMSAFLEKHGIAESTGSAAE